MFNFAIIRSDNDPYYWEYSYIPQYKLDVEVMIKTTNSFYPSFSSISNVTFDEIFAFIQSLPALERFLSKLNFTMLSMFKLSIISHKNYLIP